MVGEDGQTREKTKLEKNNDNFHVTMKGKQPISKSMDESPKASTSSNDVSNNVDENETENVCSICRALGKTSVSISYCIECQENLCESCKNIHLVSKLSKLHNVIDRKKSQEGEAHSNKLFKLLSEYTHCTKHPENVLEFYCEEDNKFLCVTCYVAHIKQCQHVQEIKQISDHQESARVDICILVDDIMNFSQFTEQITEKLNTFKETDSHEKADIRSHLNGIRSTMNKLLDSLESNIQSQHKTLQKQNRKQQSKLQNQLNETRDVLKRNLSLIEELLKIGSDRQLFVAFHKISRELKEYELMIAEKCKSFTNNMCRISESLSLSVQLSMNSNNSESLAKIESIKSSPNFPLYKGGNWYSVEKLQTKTVKTRHDLYYGPFYSCVLYATNNNILLIDSRNGRCYLINEQWEMIATRSFMPSESEDVDFKRMPSSATVLPNGVLVVSVPEEKKIYFLDSENLAKLGCLNTKYKPRNIHALSNGDIAVTWDDPVAFGIISSEIVVSQWLVPNKLKVLHKVYMTEDKNGRPFNQFDSMAVDNWRSCVVQSCKDDSVVYCFDFEGNPKFCYRTPDLQQPNGLAIDKQGFIYICDEVASCIHVLNADGGLLQIIKEGCPPSPIAIGIDSDGLQFAVSNSGFGFAGCDITFFRIMNM